MNKHLLRDIVISLRSGYQFREQIQGKPDGEFQVIQMKDINSDNTLSPEDTFTKVDLELHDKALLIENDDILFRARGYNNYATVVKDISKKTIAQSYFFIIKIDQKKAIPEYIAWYINQKPAQAHLKTNATGSNMPLISKRALEELELIIPDLETQKNIAKVYSLTLNEIKLLEEIISKKKLLIETVLLKKIMND